MIPDFEDGALPDGLHDCTPDEAATVFGRFQKSDHRIRLTERLKAYLADAARSGIVVAVIIDGSYVTAKEEPEDIDLIVVRHHDVDTTNLRPFEYNAISKSMIRQLYKFDVASVVDGSDALEKAIAYFSQVNPNKLHPYTNRTTKGLLRVRYAPPS
jgi:hypothetical protein